MLCYLTRLSKRMTKRRFPPNDPLAVRTREAYNVLHALNVEVHYLSCDSGVGRLPHPRDDQPQHHRNQRRGD